MNGKHPKRRKDKYNPYTIFKFGKTYYLSFKDRHGSRHQMEIDRTLYDAMDSFELDDLAWLNEWDRHIEQSELSEASLEERIMKTQPTVEDIVCQSIQYEQLYKAIKRLPKTQRRRLILYFFYDYTYKKIAETEGCSIHSVYMSIERAKEKIKIFLK